MPEDVREETDLLGGEFAKRAGRGMGAEGLRYSAAGGGEPTADGTFGGIEGDREYWSFLDTRTSARDSYCAEIPWPQRDRLLNAVCSPIDTYKVELS